MPKYKDEPEENSFWKVAEFWSSANPGQKVLMVTADKAEAVNWSNRADFIRWAGMSEHVLAWQQFIDKTNWVQDEYSKGGFFGINGLGMHRADILKAEIERLRNPEVPRAIKDAYEAVKAQFPWITQVFFGTDQRWLYCGEAFESPNFDKANIDQNVLEDAADAVPYLPYTYSPGY